MIYLRNVTSLRLDPEKYACCGRRFDGILICKTSSCNCSRTAERRCC
ncbi:MAG: hypothetical protein WC291_07625 [Thermodesulfovibrionales bacterium]